MMRVARIGPIDRIVYCPIMQNRWGTTSPTGATYVGQSLMVQLMV